MINRTEFFDQKVKNNLRAYDKIRKIETGQGDDYGTVFLLDYPHFGKHYKTIN